VGSLQTLQILIDQKSTEMPRYCNSAQGGFQIYTSANQKLLTKNWLLFSTDRINGTTIVLEELQHHTTDASPIYYHNAIHVLVLT